MHLGRQRMLHIKLVRPQLEYASPIWHPHVKTQIQQVEKVQRMAARWTCQRWRNRSSVGDMLSELEWPFLEACREQSSLTFFYKIYSGVVSINKDRYLSPVTATTQRRASKINNTQYCRYQSYSDALKNSFFPRTIPPSSAVDAKSTEEFKAHLVQTGTQRYAF